jgi:XTP/dITP diphosphohydrolase
VPGRLLLLATSPRVAPGLLSWSAWSALREADEVYAASADHPLCQALAAAGVAVRVAPDQGGDRRVAFLRERAGQAFVVWLLAADGDAELAGHLAVAGHTHAPGGQPQAITGSWDLPGARLLDLVAVMDRLRSPGGCPWDAGQTHQSLLPYLLEETYETVEAVESADLVGLREELGDLLLQVIFHARVAQEHHQSPWSIDDVATGIVRKLVSRHPHVFAGADAGDFEALERSWDALKQAEKQRSSVIDGVPLAQPSLALAAKLIGRASKAGLSLPCDDPIPDSAAERAGAAPVSDGEARIGALLMALVVRAHRAGVDPEAALRAAARSYAADIRAAESGVTESGVTEIPSAP